MLYTRRGLANRSVQTRKGPFAYSLKAPEVTQRLWKETMEELAFADVQTIVQKLSAK